MVFDEAERSTENQDGSQADVGEWSKSDWRLIESNRPLSAAEQIAERISQDVLAGILMPGDRIIEQEIADSFQVSRGPVRDAIRILEREGVVEVLPRRGAQVTLLTVKEVDDIFAIRGALSALAVSLATPLLTEKDLARIRAWVDQMSRTCAKGGSTEEYVPITYHISLFLSRRCQNQRLFEMIRSMSRQTLRYSHLGLSSHERRQRSVATWSNLVKALEARDAPRAAELVQRLIAESGNAARELLHESEDQVLSS